MGWGSNNWHKRGWRDAFGEMAVNVAFSPKCYGQNTKMVRPDETAEQMRESFTMQECGDFGYGEIREGERHVVLVHKGRELVGKKTAADYGIESADMIHMKLLDSLGNQLRWNDFSYIKDAIADDEIYGILEDAFNDNNYADEDDAQVKHIARSTCSIAEYCVKPGFVKDWFMFRRSIGEIGGDQPGDRGLVARAERRASNAVARERYAHAEEARARAEAQAMAAQLTQQRARQQQMALSVHDETVSIRPDGNAPWHSVGPFELPFAYGPRSPMERAPLDTGNEAMTMVNEHVAQAAGIRAGAHRITINGVNGTHSYPTAYCKVNIRGKEVRVLAAIGGRQGILVGRDVIEPLLDRGYTIAGFSAVRAGHGGAYCIQQLSYM